MARMSYVYQQLIEVTAADSLEYILEIDAKLI